MKQYCIKEEVQVFGNPREWKFVNHSTLSCMLEVPWLALVSKVPSLVREKPTQKTKTQDKRCCEHGKNDAKKCYRRRRKYPLQDVKAKRWPVYQTMLLHSVGLADRPCKAQDVSKQQMRWPLCYLLCPCLLSTFFSRKPTFLLSLSEFSFYFIRWGVDINLKFKIKP